MHANSGKLLPLLAGLAISSSLSATTYTVNSIFDTGDNNPGDNICEATTGGIQCTLRAAIEEANAHAGNDTIVFSLGLIVINISGSPLPTIVDRLTIDGSTAPNYSSGQQSAANAPPSVYISGGGLAGTTADGFRIANGLSLSRIIAMGIIDFPDNGIEVSGTDSVVLDSNWIGIGRTGGIGGNGGSGIYLSNCDRCIVGQTINQIGPAYEGRGNLINNNSEDGIFVIIGDDNTIAGNYIGLDPFTDSDQGNNGHGIHLQGPNNKIGLALNGLLSRNYVTNNDGAGLFTVTGGNSIFTNYFYRNGNGGVVLNGSGNRLGFATPDQGNWVYQNTGHGVHIGSNFASTSNEVKRNRIFDNSFRGVQVSQGTGNDISNNEIFDNEDGIRTDAASTTIAFNNIGLMNLTGNSANGIVLNSATNTVSNNVLALAADDGIDVVSGSGNQINTNNIGVGAAGQDYGNGANGVRVRAAASNTSLSSNRIGFNSLDGVLLEGGGSTLCGNRIGLGANFESAGNGVEGVRILGGGNRVGGVAVGCAANDIGNNSSDGLEIAGAANIVRDNFIGARGTTNFGNGNGGVLLVSTASQNEIVGNSMKDNGTDAVRISADAGTRNRIQENVFGLNGTAAGDLPIDIKLDGPTVNDAGDPDSGANNVQNTPEFVTVVSSPGQVEITYRINSSIIASTYPITVDFYRGFKTLGGAKDVHGNFVFRDVYNVAPNSTKSVQFDPQSILGGFGTISAMATDAEGNSSEFNVPVSFDVRDLPEEIFADGFEDP